MSEPEPSTPPADGTTPVPVPPGTTTAGTIELISVRRKMPELTAACYDGTNAVQVAGWLLSKGTPCNLVMQPGRPPVLTDLDGVPVPTGWVLPNLEIFSDQELGTTYEQVALLGVVPPPAPEPDPAPSEGTPE